MINTLPFYIYLRIENEDLSTYKTNEDSRVLAPMIEEARASEMSNLGVNRHKPRASLLPQDQSMS